MAAFAGKIKKEGNSNSNRHSDNARASVIQSKPGIERPGDAGRHPDPWIASMGDIMTNDTSLQAVYLQRMSDIINNDTAPQTPLQQNMADIQTKLEIGSPNDKFEKQANEMADKVAKTPEDDKEKVQMEINEEEESIPDISMKEFLQMVQQMPEEKKEERPMINKKEFLQMVSEMDKEEIQMMPEPKEMLQTIDYRLVEKFGGSFVIQILHWNTDFNKPEFGLTYDAEGQKLIYSYIAGLPWETMLVNADSKDRYPPFLELLYIESVRYDANEEVPDSTKVDQVAERVNPDPDQRVTQPGFELPIGIAKGKDSIRIILTFQIPPPLG